MENETHKKRTSYVTVRQDRASQQIQTHLWEGAGCSPLQPPCMHFSLQLDKKIPSPLTPTPALSAGAPDQLHARFQPRALLSEREEQQHLNHANYLPTEYTEVLLNYSKLQ